MFGVKTVITIFISLIALPTFAWQEDYHDWDTLSYTTSLKELKQTATLKTWLAKASEDSNYCVSEIDLRIGKNKLEIPFAIFEKYNCINPGSFLISANSEPSGNMVTIHFTYNGEKSGSISFMDYQYKLHLVTEN